MLQVKNSQSMLCLWKPCDFKNWTLCKLAEPFKKQHHQQKSTYNSNAMPLYGVGPFHPCIGNLNGIETDRSPVFVLAATH